MGETTEAIWFFDPNLGWWWTSASDYPFIYHHGSRSWLFLDLTSDPASRLFNYTPTGEWLSEDTIAALYRPDIAGFPESEAEGPAIASLRGKTLYMGSTAEEAAADGIGFSFDADEATALQGDGNDFLWGSYETHRTTGSLLRVTFPDVTTTPTYYMVMRFTGEDTGVFEELELADGSRRTSGRHFLIYDPETSTAPASPVGTIFWRGPTEAAAVRREVGTHFTHETEADTLRSAGRASGRSWRLPLPPSSRRPRPGDCGFTGGTRC